jgi:nicotinamidase-related amidase
VQRTPSARNHEFRRCENCRDRRSSQESGSGSFAGPEHAPYWKVGAVKRDLVRGSEAVELDPRIVDERYDYVFETYGASAFFQSPLASWLVEHCVDTVAVTGCVTSGCVRASAVDSFQ